MGGHNPKASLGLSINLAGQNPKIRKEASASASQFCHLLSLHRTEGDAQCPLHTFENERPILELVQEVHGPERAGPDGRHGSRKRERESGEILRRGGEGEGGNERRGEAVQEASGGERGEQDRPQRHHHEGPALQDGRRRGAGPQEGAGHQVQARSSGALQRVPEEAPRVRTRVVGGPDSDFGGERAGEEAEGHDERLPGASREDERRVQRDGGAEVLHGHGREGERGDDRGADLERRERELPAEGHSGAREGADPRHHFRDSGEARRRQGDREESHRPPPAVRGHGHSRRGPGSPPQRHREPRGARQFLRQARHRLPPGCQGLPDDLQEVDLLGHCSRHRSLPRPPFPSLGRGFASFFVAPSELN